jgi:hypothetical protein
MYYKRVIIDEKGKRHIANFAGEFVVMDTLTKCGVCFDSEVSFPDLKGDKDLLRFDFRIHLNDKDILIEVDGRQHKKKTRFTSPKQLKYDRMKDDYCANKGLILYRINYSSGNTRFVKQGVKNILIKEGLEWRILNNGLQKVEGDIWKRVS